MLMNQYETTVVKPDVGGDTIEAALDRADVSLQGGKLLEIDHWGKSARVRNPKAYPWYSRPHCSWAKDPW